jgi:hypothetical protein
MKMKHGLGMMKSELQVQVKLGKNAVEKTSVTVWNVFTVDFSFESGKR